MRIGLVVQDFDPIRGGLEHWAAEFAAQLLDRGHEVHVVAGRFAETVHRTPIVAHRVEGVRSRLRFARAAEEKLRSLALDVVHETGAGWYCDVFQPHYGSRLAMMEQNVRFLPPWLRPAKRLVSRALPRYRRFAALVARQYVDDGRIFLALSQKVADDFQRFHGVAGEQIRVVYNGVDGNRFSPVHRAEYRDPVRRRLGIDEETLLLLIVAHNFRLKGVPALLRAMGRLSVRDRPVHLVIVGGKRLRRYQRMAGRLRAASRVTFVGSVGDTVPFYAAADLYVHPTFYDACSLVVLEALACGLPVITSRANGVSELMREGLQGYLLSDPADDAYLADCIERFFDPALRGRMAEAARRLAVDHPLKRNCDQIEAVYREAVHARRGRPYREHVA